jgi:hypothetical protein
MCFVWAWNLSQQRDNRDGLFENKRGKNVFTQGEATTGSQRKLRHEELHNF